MQISSEQYNKLPEHLKQYFSKGNIHPTMKNIKLMSYLTILGSREGDLVLDPFIGSGTTAIAAKMLGRRCLGIEINQEYAEIAKERVENTPLSLGI